MNLNAIKYIFKTFLLIIIISFLLDKALFFTLNKISDKVYSGQSIGKLNHYLKIKDTTKFIVYGSSRANHNINTIDIIPNSFNIGMDGTRLAFSATLIKLLPLQKKQTVLLHIDPQYAFNEGYFGKDIKSLSSKYNRNSIIKNEINKLNQQNILQNFYWSLSYNGKIFGIIKNYFKPNYDYETYSGYDPIFVNEQQKNILEEILAKDTISLNCKRNLKLNILYNSYLDELKEFCHKNKKNLVLFTSPKFKDKCKDDNIELSILLKNKGLKYYDLTDFFKDNNNMTYWKDNEHLSHIGAELFTEKIKKLINEDNDNY